MDDILVWKVTIILPVLRKIHFSKILEQAPFLKTVKSGYIVLEVQAGEQFAQLEIHSCVKK